RLAVAGPLILTLAACTAMEVSGVLKVEPGFQAVSTWGETFEVRAGEHAATLNLSLTRTKLFIKVRDERGKTQRVRIKTPAGVKFPDDTAPFAYRSADIGQPWDLDGQVKKEVIDTDYEEGYEA